MKVFIVYCHPSKNSFTYEVKEACRRIYGNIKFQDIGGQYV